MEIVDYFEIKSPFLKNVESLKTSIYKTKEGLYFGDEHSKTPITIDNRLENLKEWVENLKFYQTIPGFTTPDLLDIIKAKIPDNVLEIKELNYFLKELISNIERSDFLLIKKLENAKKNDLRAFHANYNSNLIKIQFNQSLLKLTDFYFIHALDKLEFHDKELLNEYNQLFDYIFNKLMKRQLHEFGYDLNKSPFYQAVISPRLNELKKLIAQKLGEKTDSDLQNDIKNEPQFNFENNLINGVEPKAIYDFFKERLLTGRLKCLDKEKLQLWLKNAFEFKIESKPKITFSPNPSKDEIINVFFEFSRNYKKNGEKHKYVKLLSDHFAGYDYDSTFSNFKSK